MNFKKYYDKSSAGLYGKVKGPKFQIVSNLLQYDQDNAAIPVPIRLALFILLI